ncbi:similar to Saccharomyces cerevisiae YPL176C TRE1 Plasma membrane protein that binds to Bsd2p and regulates ubiquitylation and vacuolar degradation of the metal transporter Smf1p [Maudiozyma saulgeensis]|uniref:Similar to Saccharomyces cerevisiae YPL176C TRE1 Plasma membrane protein that binds to Bsd2p and regulates ubiquitylation and vacuolar degradation of the metal transporter Smf1p n=1 Tax=Maudiozyma saulgeensis TaxID=1789683 RepID=A0A1X7R4E7_9SACH|nr:similar to Saccharomyces cerevisiae YPL176C TRE1 Plasma membrane protein that binds to Bsd2p and regulates ubiquitylation and vacuolar degradation of the metal transporter Smf1p [Kazachstania saulgeensis]
MTRDYLNVPTTSGARSKGQRSLLHPPTYERVDSQSQDSISIDFDLDSENYDSHNDNDTDFDNSTHYSSDMDFEDIDSFMERGTLPESLSKLKYIQYKLNRALIRPVQKNIVNPLNEMQLVMNNEIDRYLNRFGNPLILKRFIYIAIMTIMLWVIVFFGDFATGIAKGSKGSFSSQRILFDYSKKIINLKKFETDMEYLSSISHGSGTKGDILLKDYIKKSFEKQGLDEVFENELKTYSNYPTNYSTLSVFHTNLKELTTIELTEENYTPLTINGELKKLSLIYGHYGTDEELKQLHKISVLGKYTGNYILLVKYNKEIIVSEQILTAQKYNAKGIIFISQDYNGNKDVLQMKSAGLPQYATGDILTPGYYGSKVNDISPEDSKLLTNIPIVTLTRNQGEQLLSKLSRTGLLYKDGKYSGNINDLRIDLKSETVEKRRQPVYNIIGRIDGREQNDKAIIIGSARSVHGPGASYPNFGTATLMNLVEIFQNLKYRFNWRPLRTIYFASFGGSEFNFAGSTEQVELDMMPIHDGVYSYIDISQLGLTDEINIQTNPLMSALFNMEAKYMRTFNVTTCPIQQYGDWIPFVANGVPSAALASPPVKERMLPIETIEDTFEMLHELLGEKENQENVKDIIFYLIEVILKLVDDPIIPFDVLDYVQEIDTSVQSMLKLYKHKIDLAAMLRNILKWKKTGYSWNLWLNHWKDSVWRKGTSSENEENRENRLRWNEHLSKINKLMCDEYGLPNRHFYKNVLFGPPLWNEKFFKSHDYNPWSFPGVKDAISTHDWKLANDEVKVIGQMFSDSSEEFMKDLKILV